MAYPFPTLPRKRAIGGQYVAGGDTVNMSHMRWPEYAESRALDRPSLVAVDPPTPAHFEMPIALPSAGLERRELGPNASYFDDWLNYPAGSYRVRFSGYIMSRSPDDPANVSMAVIVSSPAVPSSGQGGVELPNDGVVVASHSVERVGRLTSTGYWELFEQHVLFETDDVIELESPGVIRLANAEAYEQLWFGELEISAP